MWGKPWSLTVKMESLPPETLGEITGFLSPGSLCSLTAGSRFLREVVPELPTVITGDIDWKTLELLPRVTRVEGSVLISEKRESLLVSRRIRGDLRLRGSVSILGSPDHLSVQDLLNLLVVRGLLYPKNEIVVEIQTERRNVYRFKTGSLEVTIPEYYGDLVFGPLALLPFHALTLEITSTIHPERTAYNFLSFFRNNDIFLTELTLGGRYLLLIDTEWVDGVRILRFLPGRPVLEYPPIDNLFTEPLSSLTRMEKIVKVFLNPTPESVRMVLRNIELLYPNLESGDITFLGVTPKDSASEAQTLMISLLRPFKASHPNLEVKLVIHSPA